MVRACQWPFSAKPHTWKPFCPFCHADPCRVLKEKLQRKSYRPKDLCRWSILARQHLIWTHRMAHLKVLEAVNVLRIKLRFYSLHLSVREGISWWLSPRLLQFQSHYILTYVSTFGKQSHVSMKHDLSFLLWGPKSSECQWIYMVPYSLSQWITWDCYQCWYTFNLDRFFFLSIN